MASARDQAREAVADRLLLHRGHARAEAAADAASDVWQTTVVAIRQIAEQPINDWETDRDRLAMIVKLANRALDG